MANPFTPSSTDAAIVYLQMIFGDVITQLVSGLAPLAAGNTAATMLGEAFRYFNSGVLVFGTFILTWVTIFGIANSANDGEVLGKQWSTFYTPIRSVTAAAVLVPTSSGFAGVQILLLLVVTWSVGFASSIWTNVANYSITQSITNEALTSITNDPNFKSNMAAAVRMGACAQGVNAALKSVMPSTPVNVQVQTTPTTEKHFNETTYITTISYGDPNVPGTEKICGTLTLTDSYPVLVNYANSTFSANASSGNTSSNSDTADLLRHQISAARDNFYLSMFLADGFIPNVANQIFATATTAGGTALSATTLANVLQSEQTALATTVKQAVQSTIQSQNSTFVSNLTSQGWVFAASYWTDLGRIKDAVRNATDASVTFSSGTGTLATLIPDGSVLQAANASLSQVTTMADYYTSRAGSTVPTSATPATTPSIPALQSNYTLNDFTDGDGSAKDGFVHWFKHLGTNLVAGMVSFMNNPTEDPVMQVKNLGDWMATFAESVLLTKATTQATLAGLGETASTSSIPGSSIAAGFAKAATVFFTEIFANLSPSIFTILYAGYFLGIWLPMVPYYVFAIGVVGWLVFVIEMMAAGVLWAAAHTTPARENSFIGSQMQGYMLVMSGFFRPALMVIGLVASNAALYPSINYVNGSFMARVQAIQQDSQTGLMSIAAFMLVYCVIVSAVFMLVFGLPQTLPDRILRWVGAGVGDLGENNTMHKIEGSASGQARTAMTTAMAKRGEIDRAAAKQRDDDARRVTAQETSSGGNDFMPASDTGPGAIQI